MLIARLVALIEGHADELSARLVRKLMEDQRTTGYRRFDEAELGKRAYDVYAHLGHWLEKTSEPSLPTYVRHGARKELE